MLNVFRYKPLTVLFVVQDTAKSPADRFEIATCTPTGVKSAPGLESGPMLAPEMAEMIHGKWTALAITLTFAPKKYLEV